MPTNSNIDLNRRHYTPACSSLATLRSDREQTAHNDRSCERYRRQHRRQATLRIMTRQLTALAGITPSKTNQRFWREGPYTTHVDGRRRHCVQRHFSFYFSFSFYTVSVFAEDLAVVFSLPYLSNGRAYGTVVVCPSVSLFVRRHHVS